MHVNSDAGSDLRITLAGGVNGRLVPDRGDVNLDFKRHPVDPVRLTIEHGCVQGAGHVANVERPAAFNAAVVSFLQRHFPVH
jgi:pimeloyl-ACP methyl ester carboxylesterase